MLIGIDWGGTKIEGVAMEPDGTELARLREATPRHDYFGCIAVIKKMIERMESQVGRRGSVGIGIPGSLEPKSRLGKGASSTWLLGRPVRRIWSRRFSARSASRTTRIASPLPRPSTAPASGTTSSSP